MKVCDFLQARNITNNVVNFFHTQKIDGKVVELSSDDRLIEYGILAIGDRVTLRERCKAARESSAVENAPTVTTGTDQDGKRRRRQELLNLLRTNSTRDKVNTSKRVGQTVFGRPKNTSRTVTFGLRVLKDSPDSGDERQSSVVKSPLGDKNTIALKIEIKSSYWEILKLAKSVFFPNGESPVLGSIDDYSIELVNARNNNIEVGISPFSFGEYLERKKVPGTPKLFVLCSPVKNDELERSVFSSEEQENEVTTLTTQVVNSNEHVDILTIEMPPTDSLIHVAAEVDTCTQDGDDVTHFDFLPTSPSGEVLFKINAVEMGITDEINQIVVKVVAEIGNKHIQDPVEILRRYQSLVVTGRPLDVEDESVALVGETNFIMVDRCNIIQTAFPEINTFDNLRNTLEVQFYGESAEDLGGPRKEFFSMVLQQIKEKYFDPIREWSDDYEVIGKIFALSTLQNGKLLRLLKSEELESVFNENSSDKPYINQLRVGLNALGLYKLTCKVPVMMHLFTPGESKAINLKLLTKMLQPIFSPEGSNQRREESAMYSLFIQYLREAASGRRGNINLTSILKFITGCEEEPVLGFTIIPTVHFVKGCGLFPIANTCINKLTIPLFDEPPKDIFTQFDYAFSNAYFGLI